ncbi:MULTISPECIES: GlsB/YeaQ/YmgE family stress response membrane protein [unclassified Micromonospora]|uniref:GlsB/YeaQ/YmgE family stress response membrane protein n=2 Tax=Micromonospora TaxID=1873 RepID=UPI0010346238|nr:GlsB/YeaQ/YmgE family stress response membrane protein [Verrucosispora sp. NA02020]QKW14657.1 GlsB/YeaQ/YmgE family stress response membrane protein [Verrucosispora sp. NA02020]TBL34161.1 GlsB/YeaQ/YmgE family stress response membrane protein [Verrucosispora sp. SN26_14.1]
MTIAGIAAALVVGLAVGAVGRLVVPGRPAVPLWLTMTIGAVIALLGAISAWLAGLRGFSLLGLVAQAGLAAVGVVIVVATAGKERSDSL